MGRKPKNPPKSRGIKGSADLRGKCGAKKRGGKQCQMAAGWGTSHLGFGNCKFHGGSMPNHVKAAAKNEMRVLLGKEMQINPLDAILWCIRIRAGEVRWLSEKMAELDQKDWIMDTIAGKQFHLYAKERQGAMNDLTRYSQIAIGLGIAERAVKLAEQYGDMIARLIEGILADLNLSREQRKLVPTVVRRHLILIQGGSDVVEVESNRKALPPVERRAS